MTPKHLQNLLTEVANGTLNVEGALEKLRHFPTDTVRDHGAIVGRLDTHRAIRHGFPEVILAQGKKSSHLIKITKHALSHPGAVLLTRVSKKKRKKLKKRFPELKDGTPASCLYRPDSQTEPIGLVAVLCAGTADLPVAEEAVLTARLMGATVSCHFDAGVAGLHRLLAAEALLKKARVFIVVAGMEGALPSVVGGLVDRPVIAVPTSQGYGAAFGGLSALLGMLNSCAANVTVVNIDNGFGAGYVASLINRA
ncbi:MAG: nickel pincer cofactor biosynthesis protein LarB [Magnetococcales bacterium]|nr:nickel pincer cofactor biosynthesis protein LarB [Magnetococcales bacterium]